MENGHQRLERATAEVSVVHFIGYRLTQTKSKDSKINYTHKLSFSNCLHVTVMNTFTDK